MLLTLLLILGSFLRSQGKDVKDAQIPGPEGAIA